MNVDGEELATLIGELSNRVRDQCPGRSTLGLSVHFVSHLGIFAASWVEDRFQPLNTKSLGPKVFEHWVRYQAQLTLQFDRGETWAHVFRHPLIHLGRILLQDFDRVRIELGFFRGELVRMQFVKGANDDVLELDTDDPRQAFEVAGERTVSCIRNWNGET